ncbi:MAG: NAD-dependent epimerase/dehydratase family protein [Solirubrobacterales bacterium]|nr:NAD-dependent epimerase/dehydratase family protein [Solirubrobacterales bacterium]
MRYLLTGGSGFVGSHLAELLVAEGHHVTILDDLSTGRRENVWHLLSDQLRFVHGSVTDAALVDGLMEEADACVHLASAVGVQLIVERPLEALLANVRGLDIIMEAAARHGRRLLYTSTSEVYGKNTTGALSEGDDLLLGSPFKARWSYAIAKSFGEALAHGYNRDLGAEVVTVRLFNTVGPRQSALYGMVLPRLVRQALAGEDLTVFGDGEQTRCFIHVKDTVEAIAMLCEDPRAIGNVYNIGNTTPISIIDLAMRIIERTDSDSRIRLVPYADAYPTGFEELGRRQPDTSLVHELTGWSPGRTLDDAIDDVVAHETFAIVLPGDALAAVGADAA